MNKTIKLFVGGLPPTITRKELAGIFKQYEPNIRIELKLDRKSKLNQGYAFILVKDPVIANKIVATQYMIRGRCIQVQYSKKVPKSQQVAPLRLFCRGLPNGITDSDLTAYFDSIAPCRAAYAIKDMTGKHKGYGFIELCTKEGAQTLLTIGKFKFRDANLIVEEFNKPYRNRDVEFQEPTESIDITDSTKKTLISQNGSKFQVDLNYEAVSNNPFKARPSQHSSLYSFHYQSSRSQLWKMENGGPPTELQAYPKYTKNPISDRSTDLFKIGPKEWIFRCPKKDLARRATELMHEQDNLKFNILSVRPSTNTQTR